MGDRDAHVGRAELRQHAAVVIIDQAVDHRLRMHQHARSAPRRRPNSRAASISSSPLFIMVAESMLILAPIDQMGCRSAASGVARAISSGVAVRNGPPEAVSTIFSTAPRLPSASDWKIALCSESTGSSVAPGLPHRAQHHLAGADQRLLVGQRDDAASPDRGERRAQPGRPGDRGHGPVGRQRGRLHHGVGPPHAISIPVPASAPAAARRRRVADDRPVPAPQRAAPARPAARRCARRPGRGPGSAPAPRPAARRSAVPTLPVLPRTVTAAFVIATALLPVRGRGPEGPRRRGRRQHAVEPVEQAAMTRDEPARILHPEMPLDPALEQVARLRDRLTKRDGGDQPQIPPAAVQP